MTTFGCGGRNEDEDYDDDDIVRHFDTMATSVLPKVAVTAIPDLSDRHGGRDFCNCGCDRGGNRAEIVVDWNKRPSSVSAQSLDHHMYY
jgi:hypothetical protein